MVQKTKNDGSTNMAMTVHLRNQTSLGAKKQGSTNMVKHVWVVCRALLKRSATVQEAKRPECIVEKKNI